MRHEERRRIPPPWILQIRLENDGLCRNTWASGRFWQDEPVDVAFGRFLQMMVRKIRKIKEPQALVEQTYSKWTSRAYGEAGAKSSVF